MSWRGMDSTKRCTCCSARVSARARSSCAAACAATCADGTTGPPHVRLTLADGTRCVAASRQPRKRCSLGTLRRWQGGGMKQARQRVAAVANRTHLLRRGGHLRGGGTALGAGRRRGRLDLGLRNERRQRQQTHQGLVLALAPCFDSRRTPRKPPSSLGSDRGAEHLLHRRGHTSACGSVPAAPPPAAPPAPPPPTCP